MHARKGRDDGGPYLRPIQSLIRKDRENMKIKEYVARIEDGQVVHYAITAKGEEIRMPEAFKDMYTNDYLEISKTKSDMPEVLGLPEGEFWIPRRTTKA